MIFKQWQQVLDGTKIQTRRLVKEGEHCRDGMSVARSWARVVLGTSGHQVWSPYYPKWQVWRDYAVQPGRGKKAVGRFRITGIRRERVQDISEEDAKAEGVAPWFPPQEKLRKLMRPEGSYRNGFHELWDSIYKKGSVGWWADNPEVWVLEFEVVAQEAEA